METGYFPKCLLPRPQLGQAVPEAELQSGAWRLSIAGGIHLYREQALLASCEAPCALEVKDYAALPQRDEKPYAQIELMPNGRVLGKGSACSSAGSSFSFEDEWRAEQGGFLLSRTVRCLDKGADDQGFNTFLSFALADTRYETTEFFAPGVWYGRNEHAVKHALAADPSKEYYYIKETRMALPLIAARVPSGFTLTVQNGAARPDTRVYEGLQDWTVHESVSYAALGAHKTAERLSLDFYFPGSEGEGNYTNRHYIWARRSHPIRKGDGHCYSVLVLGDTASDLPGMVERVWGAALKRFDTPVHPCDNRRVYQAGIDLINHYCRPYHGVMGLPFKTRIPTGEVEASWMQMGFVGQQIPAAYQLLREGTRRGDGEMVRKGTAMLDFWATRSMNESGIPSTNWNVVPPTFDNAPDRKGEGKNLIWLRIVCDGMEGMARACLFVRGQDAAREDWERYCMRFADFLVSHQQEDGAWARCYLDNGSVYHDGKFNTTNALRFLCMMEKLTGDKRYLEAARRGGEFALREIDAPMLYVGGTADNDNTIDKEGGIIAMFGFLALYEATGDRRYLTAARRAGIFAATWVYMWTFPQYPQEEYFPFAQGADITGSSLIATGHSGADVYMAYAAYAYERIRELTGDPILTAMAPIILHNTKQTTDLNGEYGFAFPGLSEEGGEVARQSYRGVEMWLPWQTIAQIEPILELVDRYGEAVLDK